MEETTKPSPEKELDDLLDRYRPEHKRVLGWLDEDYGPLVFRRPNRAEMKRFVAEVSDDNPDYQVAGDNLALACVLHPTSERLRVILDELPGLGMQTSAELQKLAQATGKARGRARG